MSTPERKPDRGAQRVKLVPSAENLGIVPEGTPRLTGKQLRQVLTQEAIEKMDFPPLGVFQRAVETIHTDDEHGRIFSQLSEIGVLAHIFVPATPQIIEKFSQSAAETYRGRVFDEDTKAALAGRFTRYLQENFSSPESQQMAIKTIRALRGYAIIADETLRQLLWRIQTVGTLTFEGLKEMFGRAGLALQSEKGMETLAGELLRAEKFISAAEKGVKRTRGAESPENVMKRSPYFLQAITLLVQEYIAQHQSEREAPHFVAQSLVEALFYHQFHWVSPKQQVLALCRELQNPTIPLNSKLDLKNVITQFLLQAQLSGLIDPGSEKTPETITREEYQTLGLSSELYTAHQKLIKRRKATFTENSLNEISGDENVVTILGFYNQSHLGYRALIQVTRTGLRTLSPFKNGRRWKVVVSINERDTLREERQLMPNEPPPLPFEERKRLLLACLAGIIGEDVLVTSIERVVGFSSDVNQRLRQFTEKIGGFIKGRIVARACGYDRRDLAPQFLNPLFLALRGSDLMNILKRPEQLQILKEAIPECQIFLILLSGVTAISSTRVWNAARKYLTEGNLRDLYYLEAMTHRITTPEILKLVREELLRRGEKIVV